MMMKISGIEWDDGNWPKCGKHGLSQAEIEHALQHMTFNIPDPNPAEPRLRTAARTQDGRPVFIVYMHREREDGTYLRPISARYMHRKEIEHYERIEKAMADPANR
ncbi:BrnT family toxin [Pseudogemmobacter sonorensis]|uniref:BrnT family toxin n=1 Tax=Pseudogemmobacter sonorensis TaxID=2989681 RepID=UPI0036A0BB4E